MSRWSSDILRDQGGPETPAGRIPFALLWLGSVVLALLVAGCGNPVGTPCSIEGSGFTASHDCATKCLSRWTVNCPDGTTVRPGVCAGDSGCQPGECPSGQVCYHFDDPFETRSYCIPDNVCGMQPDDDVRSRWELDSKTAAAAMRARYESKRQPRTATAPAMTTTPATPTPPESSEPRSNAPQSKPATAHPSPPGLAFHTSPACWTEPRLFHAGPPPAEFANRLHFIDTPAIATPGEPLLSPDGSVRLWVRQPDTSEPHPWGAALVVDRGEATHRTVLIKQIGAPIAPRWLTERWIFLRLAWGRSQFSDLILDAETGDLRYHEHAYDGTVAFEQFQAACEGRCPCDPHAAAGPEPPTRFTVLAEPPTARAGDQAIRGLVMLPKVFGPAETGGVVPARDPRPVAVYAEPDPEAEPVAILTALSDFDYREYTHEGAAAVVYARRPGWYAIGLHSQSLPRGWVRAGDVGDFLGAGALLRDRLAFLNAHWDGHLWSAPAGGRRTAAPSVLASPRDASTEIPINVLATRELGGGLWLQVETLDQSPCNTATPGVVDRGWIPAYGASGALVAGYYSRGC